MRERVHRVTLFVLYQSSLALGITLLPLALLARRVGISLPVHRVIQRLGAAYENARAE